MLDFTYIFSTCSCFCSICCASQHLNPFTGPGYNLIVGQAKNFSQYCLPTIIYIYVRFMVMIHWLIRFK